MVGISIGSTVAGVRDAAARGLLRAGVTPNMLTLSALAFSALAGVCLALGAGASPGWSLDPRPFKQYAPNAYLPLAGVLLLVCSAGDMLDGAVARLGGKATTFGAFLDSTLDRFSDFAVYLGIAFYFAVRGNLTYGLLPLLAIFAGLMISYTRARAEDLIDFCTVGYWQRGERCVAILCAVFVHNIPALLFQQALLPLLTVWARIDYTRKVTAGKRPVLDPRQSTRTLDKLKLWRYPRGALAYDIVTAANLLFLIFARIPAEWDPLRKALGV